MGIGQLLYEGATVHTFVLGEKGRDQACCYGCIIAVVGHGRGAGPSAVLQLIHQPASTKQKPKNTPVISQFVHQPVQLPMR